jgi:hypothetical protein
MWAPAGAGAANYLEQIQDGGIRELDLLLANVPPELKQRIVATDVKITAAPSGLSGCTSYLNIGSIEPNSRVITLCPYAMTYLSHYLAASLLVTASASTTGPKGQPTVAPTDALHAQLALLLEYYLPLSVKYYEQVVIGSSPPPPCRFEQVAFVVAHGKNISRCGETDAAELKSWLRRIDEEKPDLLYTIVFYSVIQSVIVHEIGHVFPVGPSTASRNPEISADQFAMKTFSQASNLAARGFYYYPNIMNWFLFAKLIVPKVDAGPHAEARAEAALYESLCDDAFLGTNVESRRYIKGAVRGYLSKAGVQPPRCR